MKGSRKTSGNRPGKKESGSGLRTADWLTTRFGKALITLVVWAPAVFALTSCAGGGALKGGKGLITRGASGGIEQSIKQGENPAQLSRQEQETIRVRTYTLPGGARIEDSALPFLAAPAPFTNHVAVLLSAPMPVSEREETRARTELGAAQKDTSREFGVKLSSLRGVTWIGLGMFLLGLASLVWPPLKAMVGSVTTSAAVAAGGLALMILPSLVVGNELLILGAVALVVGAWFLAHRHGELRGLLSSPDLASRASDVPARSPTGEEKVSSTTN